MDWINEHLLQLPDNLTIKSWKEKIEYLYSQQLDEWKMAQNHYQQLITIEKRSVFFGGLRIDIQHNPARARSTCADLSKKVIEKRPCFLCAQNLPTEQKGFIIQNNYLLLINPYPIFNRHLTISNTNHVPQQISNRITDMLAIAKTLEGFTVFYNGPYCGASAPDHFHFQAVKSDNMPIEKELTTVERITIFKAEDIAISKMINYLRSVLVLESGYSEPIDYFFHKIYHQLPFDNESGEPMMNILASFENGNYRLTIFPRKAQRPSCYFKEDPERIIVSPASVEMGGLIIIPRNDDFKKITKNDLEKIFKEVSFEPDLAVPLF